MSHDIETGRLTITTRRRIDDRPHGWTSQPRLPTPGTFALLSQTSPDIHRIDWRHDGP